MPGRIEAATVDHGLRPESRAEACFVGELCARLGVPHQTLAINLADGNLQEAARAGRYAALAGWMEARGLAALMTAHHLDDQAETLLMRLNRGSSVAGLAAIRARGTLPGTRLPLLRPLLGFRRGELAGLAQAAGLDPVIDPSNEDDRFDRARIRKALAGADWLDIPSLGQSASNLADADAALDWAARREWHECVNKAPMGLVYRPQAPRAVALRVIMRIVRELDGGEPRGSAVARAFEALLANQTVSIGQLIARPASDGWSFTLAPRRRAAS